MIKDMLNRDLNMGDLVLLETSSAPKSVYALLIAENGVFVNGRKIHYPDTKYCYLIEHPNEIELNFKSELLKDYNKYQQDRLIKKENKKNNKIDYNIGDILYDKYNIAYIYLGLCNLNTDDNRVLEEKKESMAQYRHCYLKMFEKDFNIFVIENRLNIRNLLRNEEFISEYVATSQSSLDLNRLEFLKSKSFRFKKKEDRNIEIYGYPSIFVGKIFIDFNYYGTVSASLILNKKDV